MPFVAVIGAGEADAALEALAEEVGARLAAAGAVVVTGGLGGVMAAASRGARGAGGRTLGLLPGLDRADANAWVDVAVPTGMGELRNGLVVRAADALVAVGGGPGTLSEIGLALKAGKRVVGLSSWDIEGMDQAASPRDAVARVLTAAVSTVVALTVTYVAQSGREDEVRRLFGELGTASRLEAGCLQYQVHQVEDDPRTFVLYEAWVDDAALDEHRAAEHFERIAKGRLFPLLESRVPVTLRPID